MNSPKVSVIIPNYNHAIYLDQRIDTILAQSYQNIEVIILDDCSTDNSRVIINKYRSHPKIVRIELNEMNTGSPFKQWEKGIGFSTGEFIWIAESDDYADPVFLELMVFQLAKNDHVGLVYCDSHIVINDQVQPQTFADHKNRKFRTTRWCSDYVNDGKNEIEDFLMAYGTINNTSAVLFRKQAVYQARPFDIDFRFIGDKYSFIKILSEYNIAYVAQPLNYYRASPNAKPKHTNDYMDYVYEDFKIFDWIQRNMKIDTQKFLLAFQANSESSLVKGWSKKKLKMYFELMNINFNLFCRFLFYNVRRSFNALSNK